MAKNYLCTNCGKNFNNDIAGLNYKYFGRNYKQIQCLECLADYLNAEPAALLNQVDYYKNMGCTLFLDSDDIEDNFYKIAEECGYSQDNIARMKNGETVIEFRFIPTLEELSRIVSRADDKIRRARAEVFFDAENIRSRRRIGQGIHDRAEKILFAYGEPLSESDIAGLKKHQPHPVKFYSALNVTVKKNQCLDFTAVGDDFDLSLGDDLICCVNIGTLTLEEGASICVRGNLFSLTCQKIIKNGNGTSDINILPTSFSYSSGYTVFKEEFNGEDGKDGHDGNNGQNNYTPPLSYSIFGELHFGDERGWY